ncbi:hypothetical protein [Candidatus Enterococcus ferrettii]|uniref:Uncharacterized protein n=1 Tax=Candidatus Enterococcus ferrettii TaxID=2815324 RepID=A0ABV0EI07_9ENTE|nr:hypothetical protein [Enterococcus sp. 665A]MBO1339573.1 hypothetical protein [Enterococcus sp. 665A]
MKAADMLTMLSIEVFDTKPTGIYFRNNAKLQAFTGIREDTKRNLLLYREDKKPNLLMKDFFATLMKNKQSQVLYWHGGTSQEIYGISMENKKIIV